MTKVDLDLLITVKEAVKKTNLSQRVILGALERGKLKGTKFGWQWFIDPVELDLYLERRKR